jgi:hypothetical protein
VRSFNSILLSEEEEARLPTKKVKALTTDRNLRGEKKTPPKLKKGIDKP